MSVLIVTSVGDIVVDLHTDQCPLTTKNFLKLCKIKYYNGCLFHKVEKDFLAQTGDPTGTGTGGDSFYKFQYGDQARFFQDEIKPNLKHNRIGTVAMASGDKDHNASQFYFTLREELEYLDEKHTVFGIVEEKEGLDTLTKINESFTDDKGRPLKDIRIKHTYILDDPFDDPPEISSLIPDNSPEGKPHNEIAEERLEDNWVPLDETMKPAEMEELIRSKEAHTNAAILESIGDIPDADIKPPDNVLFVCKLNNATQDEDLFTIFSRFGPVTSAEIIRDYKTGDSLCYAFIEFEDKEACERAYFKMDNTLIDDRRIHVDFSQSVSRLWGQFRRGKNNQANNKDGCFKCGAMDHFAKDCDGNNDNKPKYTLKEDNTQHGYDMVFDEDNVDNSKKEEKTKKRKVDEPRSHNHNNNNNNNNNNKRGLEKEKEKERDSYDDYKKRNEERDYKHSRRHGYERSGERDYDRDRRSKRDDREERDGRGRSGEIERPKKEEDEREGRGRSGERGRSKKENEDREGRGRSGERERSMRDVEEREVRGRSGERERSSKREDEEKERRRRRDYDERERRERRRDR